MAGKYMAGETILLVEDNLVNQKLLLVVLRPHGYRLLTAQDGEEAVAVAIQEHPDLILMDLQLPKVSGYAATQRIKQHPETAGTLVIALTAHAMEEEKKNAMDVGFDGYITKPINTRTFPDQVRLFLESSR
jgi:two-component system, cell cycle response regulator DivK